MKNFFEKVIDKCGTVIYNSIHNKPSDIVGNKKTAINALKESINTYAAENKRRK